MIEKKKFYLTKEGLERIKNEYKILREQRLSKTEGESPRFWQSEELNPEYLSFREDLSFLETKISELENTIKNAELIKLPPQNQRDVIGLGATITAEIDGEMDEFIIVGSMESDPLNKKISNESPMGQALIGKKIGEAVVVKTPLVNHSCKIIKVKYNKA